MEIECADLSSKEKKILNMSSGVTERTASLGSECLVPEEFKLMLGEH